MPFQIPILDRARKYGYLYWPKRDNDRVCRFLSGSDAIDIVFNDSYLGRKRIDRRYRRISLGWKQTRALPADVSVFRLTRRNDGRVSVRTA